MRAGAKYLFVGTLMREREYKTNLLKMTQTLLMICYLMTMKSVSRYLDFLRTEYVINMVYAYLTYEKFWVTDTEWKSW